VRHFLPLQVVKVKLLGLKLVPVETSEIVSSTSVLVIKKRELEHKVIGICALGGSKRRGETMCTVD
jgi:curli biogenesis system outer membrane secretion channel CsgG